MGSPARLPAVQPTCCRFGGCQGDAFSCTVARYAATLAQLANRGAGKMSSKLDGDLLREIISDMVAKSKEKKRNFTETIELQIGLKNYDPQKDKRFSGTVKLPYLPRPRMKYCLLGDRVYHQADPPSARPGPQQGRQVPHARDARRAPREQGERGEEQHQVPAEEGPVPRRRRRQPRHVREGDLHQHADLCQLPRVPSEEELAERQDALHQDDHGCAVQAVLEEAGEPMRWMRIPRAGRPSRRL